MVTEDTVIECERCGRKLKDPKSIERGMGKTCYKKFLQEIQQRLKGVYNDSEKASQEESEKAAS